MIGLNPDIMFEFINNNQQYQELLREVLSNKPYSKDLLFFILATACLFIAGVICSMRMICLNNMENQYPNNYVDDTIWYENMVNNKRLKVIIITLIPCIFLMTKLLREHNTTQLNQLQSVGVDVDYWSFYKATPTDFKTSFINVYSHEASRKVLHQINQKIKYDLTDVLPQFSLLTITSTPSDYDENLRREKYQDVIQTIINNVAPNNPKLQAQIHQDLNQCFSPKSGRMIQNSEKQSILAESAPTPRYYVLNDDGLIICFNENIIKALNSKIINSNTKDN